MKSIQKIRKNLSAKIITTKTLSKVKGGGSSQLGIVPDELNG